MTVILYLILVLCGWISIYAASYDFDNASIFDFAERSGKQLMWIGLSLVLAFMILMVDFRVYETYAYLFYGIIILLLIATIFLAPDIKGSRSWAKNIDRKSVPFVVGVGACQFTTGRVR